MKITKTRLKEIVKSAVISESEYKEFFQKALDKAGKSIPAMSDEEKKAFFNKIDAAWDGKGEKNEELVGNQHKLDVDGDGEIEASDLAALRAGKKKDESVNEEIKVGQMVKVDNPHWEAALGKKGPFKRKVKMIDGENVFFTDGSNSSMKYIKEDAAVNESTVVLSLVNPNTNKFIKTLSLDRTYLEAEKEVETLNRRLSPSQKTKGLYWKVASIGESVNESKDFNGYVSSTDGKTFTLYNSDKKKIKDVSFDELKNKYMKTYLNMKDFADNFDKNTNKGKYRKWWKGSLVNVKLSNIDESVNEGKKVFKINPGIGKAKYSISSHDGKKKHKDGSDFYDIEIFNNKVDLEKGIKNYKSKGFIEESINEDVSDKKVDAKLIANKMRKNQSTKAFADKVEKMGKVSHKDLETILPDYVSGGLITNLFKESVNEALWPKSKLPQSFQFALAPELKKNFKGIFYSIGDDIYHNDKKVLTVHGDNDSINSIIKKLKSKIKESVNEAAGVLTIEKRKDGKYYWQYKFKSGKTEDWPAGFNTKADAQKDFMYRSKYIKESVNEGVSSADMDKIKGAVEAAKSFMNVGAELKKLGMKYTFATEPLPIYIIQPTPNNRVAIVNKKYVTKPDFVVGDIAVGIMESKSVNEAPKKLKHTISKKEWSKIPKYNKHIGMDGVHYIMKYDDKIGTYLQGVEIVDESVNEVASRTAIEIAAFTGTNKDFIQNFVDKNELDIEKVFQYVKKGKLKDRLDFVTAVAGKPNNPFQVKLIKQFKK
jgi:hypothetical protein